MGVQEAQASKQTVLHVALGGQRWAAGIQRDRQGHVSQEENHRGGCAHLLFKGQAFVDGPGEAGRRAGTVDSRPQPPAHVATTAAVHTQVGLFFVAVKTAGGQS